MSDKTEQPTPKCLREAREKGDVCKSQEISAALVVLVLALYLIVMSDTVFTEITALITASFDAIHLPYERALERVSYFAAESFFLIVFPIVFLVMGAALIGNLAQTGFLFSMKAGLPKLENLNPAKWFKKVFSVKNAVEFLKNIIKVCVLAYAVAYVLEKYLRVFFKLQDSTVWGLWTVLGEAAKDLLIISCSVFCVIAGLDFLFQKWQYAKQHMMSKDEVKREYKEMEGDPHIKSKRKQLHQELIAQNSINNVRKAKVLVTNPTHYAVALDYEKGRTPLPVVLAKGDGQLAKRMIKVAQEEGIPIMRNVPLARQLFETGTENAYIPADLIKSVAEVLRWVQSLNKA